VKALLFDCRQTGELDLHFLEEAYNKCLKRHVTYKDAEGKMRFVFLIVMGLLVFLFSGLFDQKAYAYLDPGTGSYIFQLIIAAAIGALFAIKLFWMKIVLFFKNLFSRKKKNERT